MPRLKKPWTLYPRNSAAPLDRKLFRNPTSEYRGAPFWSWNNRLDLPQLLRQIDALKTMGFGGFHIHSRTGLETEYLGEEYMRAVVACTKRAAKLKMLSWLYDEDRWPSGFAGGIVTKEEKFRARRLLWAAKPQTAQATLLASYEIALRDGRLHWYRRLSERSRAVVPNARKGGVRRWYAYLQTMPSDPWFNGQTNVDVFNCEAIERFIEVTHERFRDSLGEYFGTVIPAIFTDEPQFTKKMIFGSANEDRDLVLPFTTDFVETFQQTFGQDLLDHLPELFWNLPDDVPSVARYRYHDHTAERFASAFGDTIARWCASHGIGLTGHMLGERVLFSQTRGVGEAMRGMRAFHLPGIDILEDKMELTTAKQAQSLARQFNRPGVLSELYGVTNWDFDFVDHKAQGDWQAALGVTERVPHLAWVSMAGEAKRDYPASIGYQSPWFKEYLLIENHFARINTVMTRGQSKARVGVIHPIESYWLCFGAMEQNQPEMDQREREFRELPEWLLFGGFDFDYICERVGAGSMKYDAILVPNLRTIRSTILSYLERVAKRSGVVLFAGDIPTLVDGMPSQRPARLAKRCRRIQMDRRAILDALARFRGIEIRHNDGSPADSILHQFRIDGKDRHLFLCNTDRTRGRETRIRVRGIWNVELHDTMTGRSRPWHSIVERHETIIPWGFAPHGHLLLTLRSGKRKQVARSAARNWVETVRMPDPVRVTLSEPNVLLLDQASWQWNDEQRLGLEEILRIDDRLRDRLGVSRRSGRIMQPWADTSPAPILGTVRLRFTIKSEVTIDAPMLALEDAGSVEVALDGKRIAGSAIGWWVDEAIQTIALPPISADEHELTLTIPFSRKTNLEACYLLGDFGVTVAGRHARITSPVRELAFGDWTRQGLPFYAGNVTYHCALEGSGQPTMIEISKFRSPLLSVDLDDELAGKIAFAPFQLELGKPRGRHALNITAFGNRVNTFGALHNANENLTWFGPPAWRQTGASWSYEYQFKPMGILAAPMVFCR
jgi:hypothetical protein